MLRLPRRAALQCTHSALCASHQLAELVLTHPACWLFQTQHCENTLFAALATLQPQEKFPLTEICPQASHGSASLIHSGQLQVTSRRQAVISSMHWISIYGHTTSSCVQHTLRFVTGSIIPHTTTQICSQLLLINQYNQESVL